MFESMMRDLVEGPAKTVWVRLGLPPDDLENLWLTEVPDPSVNSSFKLGTAAQVCVHYTFVQGLETVWVVLGAFNWHQSSLLVQDGMIEALIRINLTVDCNWTVRASRSSLLFPPDGSGRGSAR